MRSSRRRDVKETRYPPPPRPRARERFARRVVGNTSRFTAFGTRDRNRRFINRNRDSIFIFITVGLSHCFGFFGFMTLAVWQAI